MKPADLLLFTRGRLEAQRAAKRLYAERLAPDFSVFDFLDTRENGLSRVIAWLLDPIGSHAQGERFLASFIAWLDLGDEWKAGLAGARAWTEVSTGAGQDLGYIDILVRSGGRGLAIENKPSAGDQPRQVERYLDYLGRHCSDGLCLLYLSGSGEGPSSSSITAERAKSEIEGRTLVVRGYASLVTWLEDCLSLCLAPNVAVTIEGLARHVRRKVMGVGDINESSDLARAICDDPRMIDAALALLEAEQPIRANILERFRADVRGKVALRDGWHVIRNDIGPDRYSAILIGFAPEATIGFGFQFDQARYGWLLYGVASEDARPLPARVKPALKAFMGSDTSTEYWPVWKGFGPNDRYFPLAKFADREFWLAAYDGRLAAMLVQFVEEVERALLSAGLLDAVRAR